jgi:hypothetical protein
MQTVIHCPTNKLSNRYLYLVGREMSSEKGLILPLNTLIKVLSYGQSAGGDGGAILALFKGHL